MTGFKTGLSEATGDTEDIAWTMLDLEGLVDAYWQHIAPALLEDGFDPERDRPTHSWLSKNGYRGLVYALREYHGRTLGEFWHDDLDLQEHGEGYRWAIGDAETIDAIEAFLERRQQSLNWSDESLRTHRTRLNQYARAYAREAGRETLLGDVAVDADPNPSKVTPRCWDVFYALDEEYARPTVERIYRTVSGWYSHMVGRRQAAFNPVASLEDEFSWDQEDVGPENPALAVDDVQALAAVANGPRDQLLVVALCAWGLRTSEVARLSRDQVELSPTDAEGPYLEFAERKNGPGTVAIVYGVDAFRDRVAEFADEETWNGYLFPSARSSTGHVTAVTIRRWFSELVERADLGRVGGREPVPQMARRFWYDRYTATMNDVLKHVGEVAAEQGSADPKTVLRNYLSPERRRELRRQLMREQLADAFETKAT